MLLDLADIALQEQPGDNLMVAISLAGYKGSYTMAAKPIKSLELHYTMIQFLIIVTPLNFGDSWLSPCVTDELHQLTERNRQLFFFNLYKVMTF